MLRVRRDLGQEELAGRRRVLRIVFNSQSPTGDGTEPSQKSQREFRLALSFASFWAFAAREEVHPFGEEEAQRCLRRCYAQRQKA